MTQKVIAFIDGASTQAAANMAGFQIDYKKLLAFLDDDDDILIRANYYSAVPFDEDIHNPAHKMLDWLSYNGYYVIKKRTRTFDNGDSVKIKNSIAVEMVTDMIEAAKHADCIALFTGDGDFKYAVERIQKTTGAYVVVFSVLDTVSDELRRQADRFVNLADLKSAIEKDQPKAKEDQEAA